jgi:hypothetical protein
MTMYGLDISICAVPKGLMRGEARNRWIKSFALNLIRGLYLLHSGTRLDEDLKATHGLGVASARVMAEYYRLDLLHTWASALLLQGKKWKPLYQPMFRIITWKYNRLKLKSELMSQEYYFLRHLEARLFSGNKFEDIDAVRRRLDELEESYRLTKNNIQVGNAYAYRALVFGIVDGDLRRAKAQLDLAAEAWTKDGQIIASGRRRLSIFRRFFGFQIT